jgi:nucleoid DNA-binding protein
MRTKKQYVAAIQELMTGVPRALIEEVLKAQERVVQRALSTGPKVGRVITVPGVVTIFSTPQPWRPERRARNPATGKMMVIPAKAASVKLKTKTPVSLRRAAGERIIGDPEPEVLKPRRLSRYERPPVI